MRILLLPPALAIGALLSTQARAEITLNATAIAELPKCVTQCAITVLPKLNCTVGMPCYCAREGPVAEGLGSCVINGCKSIGDSLKGLRFQAQSCDWPRDRDARGLSRRLCDSLFAVASFFLFARAASRWSHWGGAGFWWDDWVAFICYVPAVGLAVSGNLMTTYGLGLDMWMVSTPNVMHWAKTFFAGQALYAFTTFYTKVSLLFLYLRIWPAADQDNRRFRLCCKAVAVFLALAGIACILATIFACNPISYSWRYTNRAGGACVDRIAIAYSVGGINVVLDIIIIILPVRRLLKLELPMKQKLSVVSCFLVGFVVTAVSIVRLTHAHQLTSIRNATWDFNTFINWCAVEVNCSMICCCLPPLVGLIRRCSRYVAEKSQASLSHGKSWSADSMRPIKSGREGHSIDFRIGKSATNPSLPVDDRGREIASPPGTREGA
ncbi:CFEM domain-containing protein [Zymoseptoria brevis]|uniref:CFEM domain-containing protein n=1 Tax=Zymoseptoria brevis TaxID=1047168 RepID=A0A0F4GAV8_9PEZI|nr:CFEM domain-containing protein [Zymoseptoria brevis]